MTSPAIIHCGDGPLPLVEHHHLNLGPRENPSATVFLDIDRIHRAFLQTIPPAERDLIEVAAYVYAADQLIGRGTHGLPPTGALGAGWRRVFQFKIPVRCPDVWQHPAVLETLTSTLSFLSDDVYEFQFRPLDPRLNLQAHFCPDSAPFDGMIDEIVLFSGGLDSLAGAVEAAVVAKRRVLLVNHRSTPKVTARHERLINGLELHAPRPRPLFVPVALNKKKAFSRCMLQRTRTFLYASIAAVLARLVGRDRISFYENGVVALNLPFAPQVVGARATRGTHPRVLNGFAELVRRLTGEPFTVENSFLWDTKADIVRRIAAAGCADLIPFTTSCAETAKRTIEHPHCGVCSQCVDRRIAILHADQSAHDPATGYAVDLFTGPRPDGRDRTMLASYIERARRLRRISPLAFVQQFGEIVRVLRALPGQPADVAAQVYNLYQRHGVEVGDTITAGIGEHGRAMQDRTLDESCLLHMVVDRAAPSPAPVIPPPAPPPNAIARCGNGWLIRFRNGVGKAYPDDLGFCYLAQLFQDSNSETPASDLEAVVRKRLSNDRMRLRCQLAASDLPSGNLRPAAGADALDHPGDADLRRRLTDIENLLAALPADEVEAIDTVDELQSEKARLTRHLRVSSGLRGKKRKTGDPRNQARDRVGKAVRRALKWIKKYDEPLWQHLQRPVLTMGYNLAYRPNSEIFWSSELDAPQ